MALVGYGRKDDDDRYTSVPCPLPVDDKDKPNFNAVIRRVISQKLLDARNAEEDAACGGRRSDGGASAIRNEVYYYQYGLQGVIPPDWKTLYAMIEEQMKKEADPEFKEYHRLKSKFEGNKWA
jgi:hypothetical protein